jgi:hypothetical protein
MDRTGRNVRNTSRGERAVSKLTRKVGILAAAIAFVGIGSVSRADDLLYDWRAVDNASTPVSGFTPAPFVTDANAASPAILSQLAAQQLATPGKVAIKVASQTGLSPASIATLFNNPNFQINYAFLDIETPNPSASQSNVAVAQAQANAIHAQPKGAGTFVGNFRLFPGTGDTSGGVAPGSTLAEYTSGGLGGVNMANEDLYPGSPSYKNPGQVGGSSTAPNIRTALFTLPIERISYVTSELPTGHKHIPYVNRFNNWANGQLQNGTAVPAPGLPSQPAFYADVAHGTSGQLLSRGDFSALVAHYRLRGADGVHLLDGGVVGYTQAQFEQDAKDGFTFAPIAAIFNGGGAKIATLDTVSTVDGVLKDNEASGVVFSGVYSLSQAGGAGKLALLVSNMDEVSHNLTIPQKIGTKFVPGSISMLAGQHKLLEFTGSGTQWQLVNSTVVFADSNRDGVGVPEPVAMGGVSIFALTMLFRRRRAR